MKNGIIIDAAIWKLAENYLAAYQDELTIRGDELSAIKADNVEYIRECINDHSVKCRYQLEYLEADEDEDE